MKVALQLFWRTVPGLTWTLREVSLFHGGRSLYNRRTHANAFSLSDGGDKGTLLQEWYPCLPWAGWRAFQGAPSQRHPASLVLKGCLF